MDIICILHLERGVTQVFPPIRRISFIVLIILLTLSQTLYCSAATINTATNIPEDSTKVLPLAPEQSISTFLPSTYAPGNGLAINIIYPKKPRYKEGAPIAIVVPGGDAPSGLNFSIHSAQAGFIEIRFSFPGGGTGAFKSGGYNDYRGAKSQKALRDILLFAAGKGEDFRHRTITDLVPIKLCMNNIGVVGWSNGGNIALVTMEKYSSDLGFINWLALYECPLGSLFFPPSLGSAHDFILNSHYRQGSAATGHCLIDFRKLAWQADAHQNPGVHKKLGEPDLPGVIYFDDNNNGKWDETIEYAFNYCLDKGLNKQIYPPDITSAMERLNIFNPETKIAANPPAATSNTTTNTGNTKTNTSSQSTSTSVAEHLVSPSGSTSTITANTTNTSQSIPTIQMGQKPPPDVADRAFGLWKAAGQWRKDLERKGLINTLSFNQNKVRPLPPKTASIETDPVAAKTYIIDKKEILKNWPPSVATLDESEAYFQERDGSLSIPAVCSSYPHLLVTMLASQVDHLQCQPDHPHIVLQYNAWLDNHANWIRLNPESIYLMSFANMGKSNFVQNKPNTAIEATDIVDYLEPAGALKDYVYAEATIAELADRHQFKKFDSPLIEPLYTYDNGTAPAVTAQTNSKSDKEIKK
jgi:hypothetical protein